MIETPVVQRTPSSASSDGLTVTTFVLGMLLIGCVSVGPNVAVGSFWLATVIWLLPTAVMAGLLWLVHAHTFGAVLVEALLALLFAFIGVGGAWVIFDSAWIPAMILLIASGAMSLTFGRWAVITAIEMWYTWNESRTTHDVLM